MRTHLHFCTLTWVAGPLIVICECVMKCSQFSLFFTVGQLLRVAGRYQDAESALRKVGGAVIFYIASSPAKAVSHSGLIIQVHEGVVAGQGPRGGNCKTRRP